MNPGKQTNAADLRRIAEERLQSQSTHPASWPPEHETQRLLHELQVHQIELEMQNEELRNSRAEVEAAAARYTDLYDFAPVGYFTLRYDGTITRTNLAGATLLGLARARLMEGLRFGQFVSVSDRPAFNAFLKRVFEIKEKDICDVSLLEEENGKLFVHIEATSSEDYHECRVVVVDITERTKAEHRYLQSNRLLRTTSEVSQLIVRETDRDRLLHETCRILVESAQFRMAWVGFMQRDSGFVRPAASAGFDEGYTETISVRWDNTPEGWGPAGTAIRTGEHVVYDNLEQYSSYEPWRDMALKRGYRSSAAFPVRVGNLIVGALSVYSGSVGAISAEDVALLDELTMDLGYALQSLDDRITRGRAEDALKASEERFRFAMETRE